ncbi:MAG: hypothetical protein LAP39_19080 [Acidobacteriia bacterium]|nr:hypothetical protein [Terriglobia bacterium]
MDHASPSKTLRQIERDLEADLSYARREFEQASRAFNLEATASSEIPPQDGIVNLGNARKLVALAHASYLEALQRFTEFAAHGTIPSSYRQTAEELATDPLSNSASA